MGKVLKFRVSSALKDIIGRDLITDEFIAVFELVKNSFDAYASQVDIYFENIGNIYTRIIIKDNGKGMNKSDLENKWLFVAYSAKTEGTEDDSFDYRDNIYSNRPFAGAKGIGRFSCDKLGKHLYLETLKQEKNSKTEVLVTNWENFEENIKDEFVNISIKHKTLPKSSYGLVNGTVLVISELRAEWNRAKLLRLKDSLAKLINPNIGKGTKGFKIVIHAENEKEIDLNILKRKGDDRFVQREIVNGEVNNFIFDELELKTTKIEAKLSEDQNFISTTLHDGGSLIYKVKEHNTFNLKDINITLYYLNRSAKLTFAKRMGMASIRFGHVFLYKNGFRIFPFGEPYEDPLKINVRKSRKTNSRLGTGELIGQIEIFGDNPEFKETSSRGDGLIKNSSFAELEYFLITILERLEKYVIEVQQWGLSIEDSDVGVDMKERLTSLIREITGSHSLVDFDLPDNFIELISFAQRESAEAVIGNLARIAVASDDKELAKVAKQASVRLDQIQTARKEAEKDALRERQKAKTVALALEHTQSENLFLKSIKSQDLDEVVSFMHSIGISATTIDNYLSSIYQKLNRNIEISPSELKKAIETVSFENRKILSITRFSTKANFKLYAEDIKTDILEFVSEYAKNILGQLRQEDIKIHVIDLVGNQYVRTFKPIEVTILLDNLVSNSIRAKANNFYVTFYKENDRVCLSFDDDGKGISDINLDKIFDFGFTTTSGSGLGLFHVSEIVNHLNGRISVNNKKEKGVEFILTL